MKKTFIASTAIAVLIISFIIGCSKASNKNEPKDPSQLSEDNTFIELATETYDYLLFISNKMKANSISFSDVQSKLSILQSKNLSFNEQMTSIDLIFKSSVSQRLKEHMLAYKTIWNKIKTTYSLVSTEVLEKECAEVLSKKYSNQVESGNIAARAVDCGWRYYLCSGAATAGAILCHAACDTTALATTAGLGIPACVVACGTMQTFAIVQCSDSYCD